MKMQPYSLYHVYELGKKIKVSVLGISCHFGEIGNEAADELLRLGSASPFTTRKVGMQTFKIYEILKL